MNGEIIGNEVVGFPGQTLSLGETRLIVGLAEGEPPQSISSALSTSMPELRYIESSAQRKLGAVSRAHLITRAFLLGVLRPRAISVVLALAILAGLLLALYRHYSDDSASEEWDTWAGQSAGPSMQDPRYNGKSLRHR